MPSKVSISISIIAIFCITGLAYPSSQLHAQEVEYPLKQYSDRWEGIDQGIERVSGAKLFLVSMHVVSKQEGKSFDGKSKNYRLQFYADTNLNAKIKVRNYETSYVMQPLQNLYEKGLNLFDWPTKIPDFYNIHKDELLPLAENMSKTPSILIPVSLHHAEQETQYLSYNFCFIPISRLDRITYSIFSSGSYQSLYTNINENDVQEEELFCLNWNGRNLSTETIIPSGEYEFVAHAFFKPRRKRRPVPPPVSIKIKFYHHADFFQETGQ